MQFQPADVGDPFLQNGMARGRHPLDRGIDQSQDHRDIVRRKAPDDVFVTADSPEIEPRRGDVAHRAEFAGIDDSGQFHEYRMVLQQMAHHQNPAGRARRLGHRASVVEVERDRLFDADILARRDRGENHVAMYLRGRRHGNPFDRRVA
ncbi:MAG TPA: hypothetical protein VIC34_13310 [Croceibacterium sp.]|jgi:hypothetical protein